jgi:hypothetical protein
MFKLSQLTSKLTNKITNKTNTHNKGSISGAYYVNIMKGYRG